MEYEFTIKENGNFLLWTSIKWKTIKSEGPDCGKN